MGRKRRAQPNPLLLYRYDRIRSEDEIVVDPMERKHLKKSFSAHVRWCDPDFLHAASARFACAAFCKESRMKFASATKLDRKSGGTWGTRPARLGIEMPIVGEPSHVNL